MNKISNNWVSHLPREEREEFANLVKQASPVLERLEAIFNQKTKDSMRSMRSKKVFESQTNYSHRVADNLGYERACQELLDILKVK